MSENTTVNTNPDNLRIVAESATAWHVSMFVPAPLLRALQGFKVERAVPSTRRQGAYDLRPMENAPQWCDKHFVIVVPKVAGIYNGGAFIPDPDSQSGKVLAESTQFVVQEIDDVPVIRKMGYREALEAFGVDTSAPLGQSQTQQATAALATATASA